MNTKTLLLLGALGAAGMTSAVAQTSVYSVNAVGYVNVSLPTDFSIVSNPLLAPTNTAAALFPVIPDGCSIITFVPGVGYSVNDRDFGVWSKPNDVLAPGTGFFFKNPSGAPIVVTFVGDVLQGSLTNTLASGLQLKGNLVPQTGAIDTIHNFPGVDGDQVIRFRAPANPTGYTIYSYDFGVWAPVPTINVGEGFWVNRVGPAGSAWTRTFSVNN